MTLCPYILVFGEVLGCVRDGPNDVPVGQKSRVRCVVTTTFFILCTFYRRLVVDVMAVGSRDGGGGV